MEHAAAYGKLCDLAEAAISDPELSAKFKSGDLKKIRGVLAARGFTREDIEILESGYRALCPTQRAEAVTFWWW